MYKKRTLQLFYILASALHEYRTSKELSEMVNVTDRTIKGDIRELSNLAYDLGARIISHKGKGYRLEIEDEEVFKNAYEQLEYHFYSNYINDDVFKAGREGKLEEVFGTGTAAVISPVKELFYKGETVIVGDGGIGDVTKKLYDTMTGIEWGKLEDTKGWMMKV